MISVIIPLFNASETIIDTLNSVKNQTELKIIAEILIVNDGSTDNSYELVKKYAEDNSSLPIEIFNKDNGGVSSARNYGIKRANSEWIALLDSDDEWKPNKLEKQMNVIKKHSNIRFIGSNRNNELHTFGKKVDDDLYCLNVKNILIRVWPHTSTALIHREVIDAIGYFDEERSYGEDAQYWAKIAYSFKLYYLYDSLEIAGDGKPTYGHAGLSANLKKMHQGCLLNIKEAHSLGFIDIFFMNYLLIFEQIKYIVRIFITRIR